MLTISCHSQWVIAMCSFCSSPLTHNCICFLPCQRTGTSQTLTKTQNSIQSFPKIAYMVKTHKIRKKRVVDLMLESDAPKIHNCEMRILEEAPPPLAPLSKSCFHQSMKIVRVEVNSEIILIVINPSN